MNRCYNTFQEAYCQRPKFVQFFVTVVTWCMDLHYNSLPGCVVGTLYVSKVRKYLMHFLYIEMQGSKNLFWAPLTISIMNVRRQKSWNDNPFFSMISPSERFHRPEMSQIKAEISLCKKCRIAMISMDSRFL